ncbi:MULTISPECIES: hypothetical protein [Sphingomonadaceae]|uniref:Uncharacterized protein n=1 Tax=Sphingobium baderi TaxID=1332080 RepID=A0A0S3F5U8_9SPHN|nr:MULTISPECIES: hypothetical protein [Sphingomonadaceae]ALR23158.1 hypothetical protein ATN00_21910 [Sphingobium baderi]CDO34424.1 hypothetical protein SPHV1_1550009 [Novosphingobium sp. KN65.2]
MLEYLRKLLAERTDSVTVTITSHYQSYPRSGVYDVDDIGIAIECQGHNYCLPWAAISEIEIED